MRGRDVTPRLRRPDVALFMGSLGGGGAERVMIDIGRSLARRGLTVDLVVIRAEGPYLEIVPPEVRLVDLKSRRVATCLVKLVLYLRRERPKALLVTLETAVLVALIAKVSFARSVRVVVRQANTYSALFAHASFRDRMILRVLKVLMPRADGVVANSNGSADDLGRSVPGVAGRVQVVPNPVVTPELREQAALPAAHPWFGDTGAPVVLSVGRLASEKDHATLLRAFAGVVRSQRARLVILGEGPERGNLLRLAEQLGIAEQVDLPGFVVNPFAYMSRSRLLAHSSRYEGSPNVLVQAMACGTPVVSTDCDHGPREILEGGKWGRLVPVGDAEAMAGAILETLRDPIEPGSWCRGRARTRRRRRSSGTWRSSACADGLLEVAGLLGLRA